MLGILIFYIYIIFVRVKCSKNINKYILNKQILVFMFGKHIYTTFSKLIIVYFFFFNINLKTFSITSPVKMCKYDFKLFKSKVFTNEIIINVSVNVAGN